MVDPTTAVTTGLSRINVAARTAPREQEEKNSAKINGVLVFCRSVGDIWTQNAVWSYFIFLQSEKRLRVYYTHKLCSTQAEFFLWKNNAFTTSSKVREHSLGRQTMKIRDTFMNKEKNDVKL